MTLEEIYAHFQMPGDDINDAAFKIAYTKSALSRIKSQKAALAQKSKEVLDMVIDNRKGVMKMYLRARQQFGESSSRVSVHYQKCSGTADYHKQLCLGHHAAGVLPDLG